MARKFKCLTNYRTDDLRNVRVTMGNSKVLRFGTFSEGLARCRSCHAFTVTFEIAVNSLMQTSNISFKIVVKDFT